MALVSIVVEVKDKPGQLLKALEPVSRMGGNILGILHQREKMSPLGRIPVEISIKIDEDKVKELIKVIEGNDVIVRSYNEVRLTTTTSALLVGHIIRTDLSDTINRIDSTGYAEVVDIRVNMPQLKEPSTAMITISATGKDSLDEAVSLLSKVCRDKEILVVEPLNEGL
ncbi:MAG: amino acid-binding protein [Halobacteriota archaeon]